MFDLAQFFSAEHGLDFDAGGLVLDVGCGAGDQMAEIVGQGCRAIGIDIDQDSLESCRNRGFHVARATAESIPLSDTSVDGVICKVVLPYTREDTAISEFGRVLRGGGRSHIIGHGAGYYLYYLLLSPSVKEKISLRSLVNTWFWLVTGRRLFGFFGDTIYQSRSRLQNYYAANSLRIFTDTPSRTFLGFPVFIYQTVKKK